MTPELHGPALPFDPHCPPTPHPADPVSAAAGAAPAASPAASCGPGSSSTCPTWSGPARGLRPRRPSPLRQPRAPGRTDAAHPSRANTSNRKCLGGIEIRSAHFRFLPTPRIRRGHHVYWQATTILVMGGGAYRAAILVRGIFFKAVILVIFVLKAAILFTGKRRPSWF